MTTLTLVAFTQRKICGLGLQLWYRDCFLPLGEQWLALGPSKQRLRSNISGLASRVEYFWQIALLWLP